MFHPKSPYYSVCADVVLATPVGQVTPHAHSLTPNKVNVQANGSASDLKTISIGNNP
jgi:hypothetical protein